MDASNELTFRVYFEDTDAQGVVYYGNYLRYMERGRTEWLRDRKIQQSRLAETEHLFFTVSEMKLKYHQPARLDDIIFVRTALGKLGRVRFEFEQEIRRESSTGTLLVSGVCTAACVDTRNFRPRRLPAGLFG